MLVNPLPSRIELLNIFKYDDESGSLIWRMRPVGDFATTQAGKSWNTKFAGKTAGRIGGAGYWQVGLNGKRPMVHRVIYTMFYGEIPEAMDVDHKDGDPLNNRISNLRLATHQSNTRNRKPHKNNKSGVSGVSWHKRLEKWQASGMIDGAKVHLGSFSNLEFAIKAATDFRLANGFSLRHVQRVTHIAESERAA